MIRMIFQKIAQFSINNTVPLTVYQSNRSKLRVAIASVNGPMVRGHISFVTETHTDEGLPHTLEHLVFMGSKNYPYKGVLDVIANRCLASGTNASTDQDHTAYTLTTVGSQGFLKVLPVYMDHLLSPMLTDHQYITEVHHIDGTGNDYGVVYSEMQDHESEMERMVDQKRKNLFYPKGSSYAADTGGRLLNIRESCSAQKVRQYHKDFYHLNNMLITVTGIIDHNQLLDAIEPIEKRNLSQLPQNFNRPFQTRLPPIKPKSERIICPSDDSSIGLVEISWAGPPATDLYTIRALMILSNYLTDTAGAPLKKDFVQIEDPFCSSVHISLMEQTDCELIATFEGVPVNKLEKIQDRFFEKTIADHAKPTSFDMERLGFIIDQERRNFLSKMENNAHSLIKDALVGHQLYGSGGEACQKELTERLNEVDTLNQLKKESADYWHSILHKYFTRDCVCVMGEPSEEAVDEIMKQEEERVAQQIEKLGDSGLKQMEKQLANAIEENTKNKPSEKLLENLIVREMEKFALIPVEVREKASVPMFVGNPPFPTIVHKVPSDFIEATIIIDTDQIGENRKFLMLWAEMIFQSPAIVDGVELSYEEVAKLSTKDLVSNAFSVGISGVYDRFLTLKLRVDVPNFDKLAKWAEIYLRGIRFDPKRVLMCAKKLANQAADGKRDGNTMAHFLNAASTYERNTNTHLFGYIALEKFHKGIARAIEKNGSEDVIKSLEQVRSCVLASPLNVHFAGDPEKLANETQEATARWKFLANDVSKNKLECLPEYGQTWELEGKTQVISVGGSESAFLLTKAKYDGDWNAETTMPALLLSQYISQTEGPLWNAIRGTGLAYDASIYLLPDRKTITLSLYRCSQLVSSYEKTKETVLSILDSGKLDEGQFEAAKRSLVCELIGGQSTVKLTATAALLATFRGVGLDFTQELCKRVWTAQIDDVLAKGAAPFRRLFDPKYSITSIATNPSRIEEIKKNFPDAILVKIDDLQVPPPKF